MSNDEKLNIFICLVGSNPLPNYIVAEFLMKYEDQYKGFIVKPDTYFFVHTGQEGTKDYAKRIKRKLSLSNVCEEVCLSNPRNAKEIQDSFEISKLNKLIKNDDIKTIHLNYTGGTKPMAVLTYKWLQEHPNRKYELTLSDIDPRNNKLNIIKNDKEESSFSIPEDIDLIDLIDIDIKDLLEMHDMEFKESNEKVKGQIDRYLNVEGLSNKEQWEKKQKFFIECLRVSKGKKVEKLKNILKINQSLQDRKKNREAGKPSTKDWKNGKYKEINEGLCLYFGKYMPDYLNKTLEEYKEEEFAEIVELFASKWLEYYIYEKIAKILEKGNLTDKIQLYHSVKVNMKVDGNDKEAEIDVIAIKGYKLYYFTVTTSDGISICKQKAFEGIFRARQLGGEHAKVVAVNMMPYETNKDDDENYNRKLEADLKSFKAESGEIDIIGYDELKYGDILESKLYDVLEIER